jgi:hypothetical protein
MYLRGASTSNYFQRPTLESYANHQQLKEMRQANVRQAKANRTSRRQAKAYRTFA